MRKINSNFLFAYIFQLTEKIAREFYFTVLVKQDIFSPSLNEKIIISHTGWEHLHAKTRRKSEMLFRYFVLPKILVVLEDPESAPIYEEGRDSAQKVEFWHFLSIVDEIAVKIVIRAIEKGPKHLFSVMWRGEVEENKKGAVFRMYKRSRGVDTPQLQKQYSMFIKTLSMLSCCHD